MHHLMCVNRETQRGCTSLARAGEIKNFTGIDDPYEQPLNPELVLKSADHTPDQLANQVIEFLQSTGKLSS